MLLQSKNLRLNNYSVQSNETSLPALMGNKEGMRMMLGETKGLKALRAKFKLFAPYKLLKLSQMKKGIQELNKALLLNPAKPLTEASETFIKDFEDYAKSNGAASIGYTKVTPKQMLKGQRALYPNTIVVTMEMDRDKIAMSPSRSTEMMVFDTYHNLNILTTKLAKYLQKKGYAAQPGSSIGGVCHYPWIGEMAGLGYRGKHGLLITPELGPRQRIAVIFTSIESLPFCNKNEHGWIKNFCKGCNQCVKVCPAKALKETPEAKGDYTIHLDHEKCFNYFALHDACGICLNQCIFNKVPFEKVKDRYIKKVK